MKFGIQIPAGREGIYIPSGFSTPEQLMGLFTQAESLGFYSAWGNDHLNTPRGARYRYDQPPNVYEILITLAYAAATTERIRLGVAALTLPQREPVTLAKQVATLDVFSKGRVSLAVGIGHYRDEFVNVRPRQKQAHRGEMFEEALEALHLIFTQNPASFSSKHYEFEDISLHPKPLQDPVPHLHHGHGTQDPGARGQMGHGLDADKRAGPDPRRAHRCRQAPRRKRRPRPLHPRNGPHHSPPSRSLPTRKPSTDSKTACS